MWLKVQVFAIKIIFRFSQAKKSVWTIISYTETHAHWKRKTKTRWREDGRAGQIFDRTKKAVSLGESSVICTAAASRQKLQGADRNYKDKIFSLIFFETYKDREIKI